MPEGPECHLYAHQLHTACAGKWFINANIVGGAFVDKPRFAEFRELLQTFNSQMPQRIESVQCKGKFIYFTFHPRDLFPDNQWALSSSMGMSGNWRIGDGIESDDPKQFKHYHFYFTLFDVATKTRQKIWFKDQRHQGYLKLFPTVIDLEIKLQEIGHDLFPYELVKSAHFNRELHGATFKEFETALTCTAARSNKPIGKIIHDAKIVSGVGNYIRAEALYRARISPHRLVGDLTTEQLQELWRHIRDIMAWSFDMHGMTSNDYFDIYGNAGTFESQLKVYNHGGEYIIDGNKKHKIIGEKLAGDDQTMYWVPGIQK